MLVTGILFLASCLALAPIHKTEDGRKVNNHYIVRLKNEPVNTFFVTNKRAHKSVLDTHLEWFHSHPFVRKSHFSTFVTVPDMPEIHHIYNCGFFGYAGTFNETFVTDLIQREEVLYVEEQATFSIYSSTKKEYETQYNAPWHLHRISEEAYDVPSSTEKEPTERAGQSYIYPETAGRNVIGYIVDTGISSQHEDFENRLLPGFTVSDSTEDDDAHGTHVASTFAGKRYGVAKRAQIVPVKVLENGSGSTANVLRGFCFVMEDSTNRRNQELEDGNEIITEYVLNASLGGPRSLALDDLVDEIVRSGVHVFVAAGNSNVEACRGSPAASAFSVVVGATDVYDQLAKFSNYGSCVDVMAPGVKIRAAKFNSRFESTVLSGTSMASPVACGVGAVILSEKLNKMTKQELKARREDPSKKSILNPFELKDLLIKSALKGVIKFEKPRTSNNLVFVK